MIQKILALSFVWAVRLDGKNPVLHRCLVLQRRPTTSGARCCRFSANDAVTHNPLPTRARKFAVGGHPVPLKPRPR